MTFYPASTCIPIGPKGLSTARSSVYHDRMGSNSSTVAKVNDETPTFKTDYKYVSSVWKMFDHFGSLSAISNL